MALVPSAKSLQLLPSKAPTWAPHCFLKELGKSLGHHGEEFKLLFFDILKPFVIDSLTGIKKKTNSTGKLCTCRAKN
jgi:predicted SprT family Zn-dependent metalloprotease